MHIEASGVHSLATSRATIGPRSFRDAALRRKVSSLIDVLLHTLQAGTGRQKRPVMDDSVVTIDTPDGWHFAYEGGAHTLFRYCRADPRFEGRLLRLAKRNKHTLPILKKHQSVLDTFVPLLTPDNGENLVVHTELVKIGPGVLQHLQSSQVAIHTKRQSVLDLDETHGTLLEDLSADPSILLLDFKPKWLSQSPTAPKNATTCRTCALRRLRRKQPKANPRFCPLDLSSGDRTRVQRAVTAFLEEKGHHNPALAERITQHLMTSKLLPTLLQAQTSPHSSLATKMTLRDCTLFIQIPKELVNAEKPPNIGEIVNTQETTSSRRIRIVIADLDEKSEANRGEYWKSLEDQLIKGGYYLGAGKPDNAEDCDLTAVDTHETP